MLDAPQHPLGLARARLRNGKLDGRFPAQRAIRRKEPAPGRVGVFEHLDGPGVQAHQSQKPFRFAGFQSLALLLSAHDGANGHANDPGKDLRLNREGVTQFKENRDGESAANFTIHEGVVEHMIPIHNARCHIAYYFMPLGIGQRFLGSARLLLFWLVLGLGYRAQAADKPVWLLGNDFHTSLVFRARDIPFRREITGDPGADELAIGWGAAADYRGPSTPWTVLQALVPNHAALHVVPIRGPITRRFPHSDVVLLRLKPGNFARLVAQVDRSFAHASDGRRILLGRGYYADSRFYASSERFIFPYVCNTWVAVKLGHAGIPFFLPRALLSNSLILQAGEKGRTLQRHHGAFEAY